MMVWIDRVFGGFRWKPSVHRFGGPTRDLGDVVVLWLWWEFKYFRKDNPFKPRRAWKRVGAHYESYLRGYRNGTLQFTVHKRLFWPTYHVIRLVHGESELQKMATRVRFSGGKPV